MCPTLSRKGKLYATSTKCVPKKTKKKKTTSKKSKKKATKKSKKSKAKKKPSITLKPIGKKSIVGGNKFKFTGLRKDGAKKYSNGKSELLFYPKDKKWSLKEKGIGWASGKKGQLCPTLLRKGKLYATSTKCSPKKKKAKKTTKKSSKKRVAKKSKKSKAQKKSFVTLKPVGKKAIFGGNKFKSAGVRKDGTKKYSNGKSVLLFYPKDKKWALKEKGLGWATGKKGQMCPTLSRKGKLYATSTECVPKNKNISSKKGKKIAKRTSKKSKKSKSKNKSFITLKPVGKKSIVGGNVFKSAGIRKDGVRKYTNGKSELLFYPKDKKWSLKEKGIGWASGKKGQMCPTLSRKGKLYATSTRCVINDKKSSKKSSKKNKKTKTKYPKTNVTKIVKLKPVPKYQIDGGNTFKFQKVRKDGILKYSNGKAKLILGPKERKWALKDQKGWAVGKQGDECPVLTRRGKPVAKLACKKVSDKILKTAKGIKIKGGNRFKYVKTWRNGVNEFRNPKGARLTYEGKQQLWLLKDPVIGYANGGVNEMICPSFKKKGRVIAEFNDCKRPANKSSKKSRETKKSANKKSFATARSPITLKPTGKSRIKGGNKFKFSTTRKDGALVYSNGQSQLLFYPKDKKWALKEKYGGWAVGKKGVLCPKLSKNGKLYATSKQCLTSPSKKEATKSAQTKTSVTLKPIGKKLKGGNTFKLTGIRKDGVLNYSNGQSKLLFYPKNKKWALKEKGRGWAVGKPGAACPVLTKKGKPYAFSKNCKTTRKTSKKSKKLSKKVSFGRIINLKPVGKKNIIGGNKFNSAGTRKDGVKQYSNGKSKLLFYPKNKKWALKEKGRGWAVGKSGVTCPVLTKKGKPYAFSTSCKSAKAASKKSKRRSDKISYNSFKKFLVNLMRRNKDDSNLLSSVYKLAEKNKSMFK